MAFNVLDVGSGWPWHRSHKFLAKPHVCHVDIDKKAFHVEVQADIHKLPFADESFRVVHCSHVLEHVTDPPEAIRELKRVSRNTVVLCVPNALRNRLGDSDGHIYSWNVYAFKNLLWRHFNLVRVRQRHRFEVKTGRLLFKLKSYVLSMFFEPSELVAVCRKHV